MSSVFTADTTAEEVGAVLASFIKGKNVLITGVSPGSLGAEAARVIAKYSSLVILAGRSLGKLQETVQNIKKETPSANLRTLILDLNSLEAVRTAAQEVNEYEEHIHVLINNAAIMASPYAVTKDGFESQLGINHLAPFLFTALIFPSIKAAASPSSPSRIVNVSSVAHVRGDFRFDDYSFSNGKTYEMWTAYSQSKTANVLFANELARRSKEQGLNVLAYSLHPGRILTNLLHFVENDELKRLGVMNEAGEWTVAWKSLEAGAATHLVAAFDPSLAEKTGAYLCDGHISEENRAPYASSQESGEKLWRLSEALVKESFIL